MRRLFFVSFSYAVRAASKSSFEGELEAGGYVSDKEEGELETKGPVLDMAVM